MIEVKSLFEKGLLQIMPYHSKFMHLSDKRYLILVLLMFFSVSSVFSQNKTKIPSEKPRLVVEIVVEQMRYDALFRYWDKFRDDGFRKLMDEGTFCKNANYNYLFTQKATGHATIATGANPSMHGIVANQWYDRLSEKTIYCTRDENEKTIGSNSIIGRRSPRNLSASTLGDELMLFNNKKSKVVSIAMDGDAAVLSIGHIARDAYWYDDETGTWITSSFYSDTLPSWVKEFNNKKFSDLYLSKSWEPLHPINSYNESLPDKNTYEYGFSNQITFPYDLNTLSKARKNVDYSLLRYTPYGNTYTCDFAASAIVKEELGKDDNTDLLIVGFSATGALMQKFVNTSVETEDMYLRLDEDISHFLSFIDQSVGKENVLIVLTSDHGCDYSPKYLEESKLPVGYFSGGSAVALLRSYLNAVYGKGNWIKTYNSQQIYLNRNEIENSKLSLGDFQEKVAQFLIQFAGVQNALTSTVLQSTNFSNGISEKMQNSFNQERSGDILINLVPGWMEKDGDKTASYSAYNYDTHVPLIWYGWKMGRSSIYRPVDISDIAPTIATFLNIPFPNACSGKPIYELVK
jgi:predicted AlkP superfamily pyrophosphatase or phosphodiesterase